MHKLIILSTVAFLAGTSGVLAEDNADLLQPVSHGAVTGDVEKDTVAFAMAAPADLWVRVSDGCLVRGAPPIRPASFDKASLQAVPR